MAEFHELVHIPSELEYLERQNPTSPRRVSSDVLTSWSSDFRNKFAIPQTASNRLTKLARSELTQRDFQVSRPSWLNDQAIPRLIVTAKYLGNDAYGASRLLADLDLAARRAGAMQKQLLSRGSLDVMPVPLRTHQGGLSLLDTRVGSFEIVTTIWGSLVTIAGSSPVSVASLIALAYDFTRVSASVTSRWVGVVRKSKQDARPELGSDPTAGLPWGVQQTKTLAPVLADAVASGLGFEFALNERDRQIKLTVPSKSEDR